MEDLKSLLAKGWKVLSLAPRPSEERELSALFSDFHIPQSRALESDAGPRLITLVRLVEGMLGASSRS